jgi:hypothetical protein
MEYTKRTLLILEKLQEIQHVKSTQLYTAIADILPPIAIQGNFYQNFKQPGDFHQFQFIQELSALAVDTNNPFIQIFICKYNVNNYIYTQTVNNLPIDPELLKTLFPTFMKTLFKRVV